MLKKHNTNKMKVSITVIQKNETTQYTHKQT